MVLVVILKVAGDTPVAKFCQDALSHIFRHPRSGCDGLEWVGMGGDGWGWVWMGWDGGLGSVGSVRMGARMGAGRGSCGQAIVLFTFQLRFLGILKVFAWVLGGPGLRLGSDWAPWLRIEVLGVTFGGCRLDFG